MLLCGWICPIPVANGRVTKHHNGWMWDLTITNDHDFYVLAASAQQADSGQRPYYVKTASIPVLVHNCGGTVAGHSTKCACGSGGIPRIIRNQFGRAGGIAHQAVIDQVEQDLQDQGFATQREFPFSTPGGFKTTRAVDIAAFDSEGDLVSVHQVGKMTASGFPVMRETQAMSDIWSVLEDNVNIVFHRYN